jgi:hypothetical protein
MRVEFWAAILLVALGAAGCKSGPVTHVKEGPKVVFGNGWSSVTSPDKTVSIGIPPGWGKGLADQLSTGDIIGMAGGELSQAAMDHQQQELDRQYEENIKAPGADKDGLIISVVDRQNRVTPGEQRTRYTVRVKDMHSGVTLDEAAEAAKGEITGEGPPKKVTLPIGPAIRYDSSVQQRSGSTVTKVMYVVVDGAKAYWVTFTTESAPQLVTSNAEAVIQTLRIKPSKDQ